MSEALGCTSTSREREHWHRRNALLQLLHHTLIDTYIHVSMPSGFVFSLLHTISSSSLFPFLILSSLSDDSDGDDSCYESQTYIFEGFSPHISFSSPFSLSLFQSLSFSVFTSSFSVLLFFILSKFQSVTGEIQSLVHFFFIDTFFCA